MLVAQLCLTLQPHEPHVAHPHGTHVAHQTPLSMEFSRQEYWSRLPFSTLGHLPCAGIEPVSLASPELADGLFTTMPPGKPSL